MNCNRFESLIWNYLEGHCDTHERHEMKTHAAGCVRCRQALATAKASFAHLRSLPRDNAPAGLAEKTRTRLQHTLAPSSKSAGWRHRLVELGRRANVRWALAPAIGAVLIGILWVQSPYKPSTLIHRSVQPVENRTLADAYADACIRIHEQVTASELNGDPTTDYLLMNTTTKN